MRSLYLGIAIVMLASVWLAFLAFDAISVHLENEYLVPVFEAMDQLELESARGALANGGRAAVASYLTRLDRTFGTVHHLLDRKGTDAVSGRNMAAVLPHAPAVKSRGFAGERFIVTQRSADGRYWLVSIGPKRDNEWPFTPYFLVAIGMAAALCLLAAAGIVFPIRKLTRTVERFGRGDLTARAKSRRRDEIGGLARSFDNMADRIERLLTGERRLLEDVSHELRSPLARLKLAVKLARTAPDPKMAFDRIERDIDRISALASEIVEMVRMEGDPQTQAMEPVDLGALLDEAVGDSRAEKNPRDIHMDRQFTGDIVCNRVLLRRAIENVLGNAMRYSPDGAPINIALHRDDQRVTISIRDYGPGVPEAALPHIFKPFYRADEARTASGSGVGLGLSIARRAVQLHRGTITAQNGEPGLRVRISLPLGNRTGAG